MRLLDLFCGAGGASMGYHRAGFEVIGVDIDPQPNYPFEFFQGDAFAAGSWAWSFDVIHASPPCQAHSRLRSVAPSDTGWMLAATRELLDRIGRPWVIENVPGAPMANPVPKVLCGSMFGLGVRRHRLFQSTIALPQLPHDHESQGKPVGVYGHAGGTDRGKGRKATTAEAKEAMDIDWMTHAELAQAIPPAYTEWIGNLLIMELVNR
jgi:DNA (cytosine-5)-methyltransferase 1